MEALLATDDGGGIELPVDEDDMIAVNYTSGTTGRPKGVVYTHRGAYLNAVSVALEFEITSTSWHLWTLPMFHCNGWSLTWGVTVVGGTHVCLGTFDARRALELADRYPVTHLCGAPVVLGELARAGAATGFVAKRPIRAAVGGAPPTKETIAAVQAMGVRVTHLYGLTETYGPSLVCEYQDGWAELPAAELAGYLSRQGVPRCRWPMCASPTASWLWSRGRKDGRRVLSAGTRSRPDTSTTRRHGGRVPGRLVPHRGSGRAASRRVRRTDGSQQGCDHQRRREHRHSRSRAGPATPPGCSGGGCHRGSARSNWPAIASFSAGCVSSIAVSMTAIFTFSPLASSGWSAMRWKA